MPRVLSSLRSPPPGGGAPPTLRGIVDRYLAAINARDFDAWSALLAEDVEVLADAGPMRGRAAARRFAESAMQVFPGCRARLDRVVAETADTIVVELSLVNPVQGGLAWRLEGTACNIYEVRDSLIVRVRSYYLPAAADRTDIAPVPSRTEAAVIASERAALRRVATLVARGGSQDEVFGAVSAEVAQLVRADSTALLRFDPHDTVTLVASWSADGSRSSPGERRPVDPELRSLRDEGRTLRFGPAELPRTGPFAEEAQRTGIRTAVGVPITVDGELWGASFVAATGEEPFAEDTEARIAGFTELVATAIANAQARSELRALVEEQTALRFVATLVASGASHEELFDAVMTQASRVMGGQSMALLRFEAEGEATVVAERGGPARLGAPVPTEGDGLAARMLRTGRPARIDDYAQITGPVAPLARELGIRAAAGAPIVVAGRPWGAIEAVSVDEPLPPGTELRIAHFSDLVATAIANAEARAQIERLADQHAALRRVATLVAEGASPTAVFDAVAEEMERLLDADGVTMGRYEPDGEVTFVAHRGARAGSEQIPPGTRVSHEGENVTSLVRRSKRPARLENYERTHGPISEMVERLAVRAAVGAPVVVNGRLWGAIIANWRGDVSPPADTEERMAQFAQLLDSAIANADTRDQLTASRSRLLTAGDEARRRVVRDLHDGAQQRLVHTIMTLTLAQGALERNDGTAGSWVGEALQHAKQANEELRELAHGILPAVLTRGGLRAGIDSLRARLDIPVRVDVPARRFPAEIEASAYFIVAEALTNVAKHSQAGRAEVKASAAEGMLHVEVRDDGTGGADRYGPGLVGIADRAAALGGRLEVESPAAGGTLVAAMLPFAPQPHLGRAAHVAGT